MLRSLVRVQPELFPRFPASSRGTPARSCRGLHRGHCGRGAAVACSWLGAEETVRSRRALCLPQRLALSGGDACASVRCCAYRAGASASARSRRRTLRPSTRACCAVHPRPCGRPSCWSQPCGYLLRVSLTLLFESTSHCAIADTPQAQEVAVARRKLGVCSQSVFASIDTEPSRPTLAPFPTLGADR